MKKTLYPGILAGWLLACFCVACSPLASQEPQPETETSAPIASPAETATRRVRRPTASPTETATPAPLPTETLAPATPTSRFAPICELGIASTLTAPMCQRPIAEEGSAFCMNKVAFNLIYIEAGATYEVLNEGLVCSDAGMKDGRQMLICTGPMGDPFEIKACGQQACALPTSQAESSQCPQGFLYSEPQGCCAFLPQSVEESCVSLTLKTKRCVVDCAEFIKENACNHHYHACEWNDEDKVCQVRPYD